MGKIDPLTGLSMDQENLDPLTGLPMPKSTGRRTAFTGFSGMAGDLEPYNKYGVQMSEYTDMDEERAQRQSTAEQWRNGLTKAAVTTAGAFSEATVGTLLGLGDYLVDVIGPGEADFDRSMSNNAVGLAFDKINEDLQTSLPNYYTQEERDEQGTMGMFGSANFWADKFANGAAYTLGTVAAMAVTGGYGAVGGALRVAGATGKVSKALGAYRAAKAIRGGTQTMEALRKGATLKNTVSRIGRGAEMLEAGAMMSMAEAAVESRETKKIVEETLTEEAKRRKFAEMQAFALETGNRRILPESWEQVELDTQEIQQIQLQAQEAEGAAFYGNMAVLMPTNLLMFGKMAAGFRSSGVGFRKLAKDAETGVWKEAVENLPKGVKQVAQAGRVAAPLGKQAITEGYQEGMQYAISQGVSDYELRKLKDSGSGDLVSSLMNAGALKALKESAPDVASRASKSLTDPEAREQVIIGAMVGLLGGGRSALKEYRAKKDNTKKVLEFVNSETFNNLAIKSENVNAGMETVRRMIEADKNGDKALYERLQKELITEQVLTSLKLGSMDMFRERWNDLRSLSEAEFKEAVGIDESYEFTKEYGKDQIIDGILKYADKVEEGYKLVNDLYNYREAPRTMGLPRLLMGKERRQQEDERLSDFEIYKDFLIHNYARMETIDEDILKVLDDLVKAVPNMKGDLRKRIRDYRRHRLGEINIDSEGNEKLGMPKNSYMPQLLEKILKEVSEEVERSRNDEGGLKAEDGLTKVNTLKDLIRDRDSLVLAYKNLQKSPKERDLFISRTKAKKKAAAQAKIDESVDKVIQETELPSELIAQAKALKEAEVSPEAYQKLKDEIQKRRDAIDDATLRFKKMKKSEVEALEGLSKLEEAARKEHLATRTQEEPEEVDVQEDAKKRAEEARKRNERLKQQREEAARKARSQQPPQQGPPAPQPPQGPEEGAPAPESGQTLAGLAAQAQSSNDNKTVSMNENKEGEFKTTSKTNSEGKVTNRVVVDDFGNPVESDMATSDKVDGKPVITDRELLQSPDVAVGTEVELRVIETDWWVSNRNRPDVRDKVLEEIPIFVFVDGKAVAKLKGGNTTLRQAVVNEYLAAQKENREPKKITTTIKDKNANIQISAVDDTGRTYLSNPFEVFGDTPVGVVTFSMDTSNNKKLTIGNTKKKLSDAEMQEIEDQIVSNSSSLNRLTYGQVVFLFKDPNGMWRFNVGYTAPLNESEMQRAFEMLQNIKSQDVYEELVDLVGFNSDVFEARMEGDNFILVSTNYTKAGDRTIQFTAPEYLYSEPERRTEKNPNPKRESRLVSVSGEVLKMLAEAEASNGITREIIEKVLADKASYGNLIKIQDADGKFQGVGFNFFKQRQDLAEQLIKDIPNLVRQAVAKKRRQVSVGALTTDSQYFQSISNEERAFTDQQRADFAGREGVIGTTAVNRGGGIMRDVELNLSGAYSIDGKKVESTAKPAAPLQRGNNRVQTKTTATPKNSPPRPSAPSTPQGPAGPQGPPTGPPGPPPGTKLRDGSVVLEDGKLRRPNGEIVDLKSRKTVNDEQGSTSHQNETPSPAGTATLETAPVDDNPLAFFEEDKESSNKEALKEAESGEQGISAAEIESIKQQLDAMLPDPDAGFEDPVEMMEAIQMVEASPEYQRLLNMLPPSERPKSSFGTDEFLENEDLPIVQKLGIQVGDELTFTYNGGSREGQKRTVRVSQLLPDGKSIVSWDTSINEERQYNLEKAADDLTIYRPGSDVPFRLVEGSTRESISESEAKAWLKARGIPVEFYETAKQVGSGVAHGYMKNAAVYLWKNAEVGTEYHEAFHYMFRMMLTDAQREGLYGEARTKYALPNASELELEEAMAEDFRDYVFTAEATAKTLPGKIRKFFKDIWNYIKAIFSNRIAVDQFFSLIESNRVPAKLERSAERFANTTAYRVVDTALTADMKLYKSALDTMSSLVIQKINQEILDKEDLEYGEDLQLLNSLLGKNSEDRGYVAEFFLRHSIRQKNGDVISETAFETYKRFVNDHSKLTGQELQDAYKKLVAFMKMNNLEPGIPINSDSLPEGTKALSPQAQKKMAQHFYTFYNQWFDVVEERTGNVDRYGWREAVLEDIEKYGYKIKTKEELVGEFENEEEDGNYNAEEVEYDKIYSISHFENDPSNKISQEAKRLFGKMIRKEPNAFGFNTYADIATTYKAAVHATIGLETWPQMVEAINKQAQIFEDLVPVAEYLLNDVTKQEAGMLRSLFTQDYTEHRFLLETYEETGTSVRLIGSDRRTGTIAYMQQWKNEAVQIELERPAALFKFEDDVFVFNNNTLEDDKTRLQHLTEALQNLYAAETIEEKGSALSDVLWYMSMSFGQNKDMSRARVIEYMNENPADIQLFQTQVENLLKKAVKVKMEGGKIDSIELPDRPVNFFESESTTVKAIANRAAVYRLPVAMSFISGRGKSIYPYNTGSHFNHLLNELSRGTESELFKKFQEDESFHAYGNQEYQSYLYQMLESGQATIETFSLDTIRDEDNDRNNDYTEIATRESLLMRFNTYFNTSSPDYAYYPISIQESRGRIDFIKMPKFHRKNSLQKAGVKAQTKQQIIENIIVRDLIKLHHDPSLANNLGNGFHLSGIEDTELKSGLKLSEEIKNALKYGRNSQRKDVFEEISRQAKAYLEGTFQEHVKELNEQVTQFNLIQAKKTDKTQQAKDTNSTKKVRVGKVISGGQTGADRIGLEIAKELGIATGGIAPKGYKTESGNDPSLKDFGLTESNSDSYAMRTEKNVLLSNATVLFGDMSSPGSKQTIKYLKKYKKPYIENPTQEELAEFLAVNNVSTLNVAGNRGSKFSEAQADIAKDVLKGALTSTTEYAQKNNAEQEVQKKADKTTSRLDKDGIAMFSSQRNMVENFHFDSLVARIEMSQLLRGGATQSASVAKFFKRMGLVNTPGTRMMLKGEFQADPTYGFLKRVQQAVINPIRIADEVHEQIADRIEKAAETRFLEIETSRIEGKYANRELLDKEKKEKQKEITAAKKKAKQDAKQLAAQYRIDNLAADHTDGQAYVSPWFHRGVMMGLGQWQKSDEAWFQEFLKGGEWKAKYTPNYKFYYENLKMVDGQLKPEMDKNSYVVLTPELVKGNELLSNMYDRMMARGKYANMGRVDLINTTSAKKGYKTPALTVDSNNTDFSELVISEQDGSKFLIPQVINKSEEYLTKMNRQIRKNIISAVDRAATYTVAGETMTGQELLDEYHSLVEEAIVRENKKLLKDLGYDKMKANPNDVEARLNFLKNIRDVILRNAARDGKLDSNMQKQLKIVEGDIVDFAIPMAFPAYQRRYQNLLFSLFKNNVHRLDMPGKELVQVASSGKFSITLDGKTEVRELRHIDVDTKTGNLKYAEVIVSEDMLEELGLKLGETGIAYRIPHQGYSSTVPIRIVGVLPRSYAKTIIVPGNITIQTGSDFDIDKLFVMLRNMRNKSRSQEIRNRLLDIMEGVTLNKTHMLDTLKPLTEETLNELSRRKGIKNEVAQKYTFDHPMLELVVEANFKSSAVLVGTFANGLAGFSVAVHGGSSNSIQQRGLGVHSTKTFNVVKDGQTFILDRIQLTSKMTKRLANAGMTESLSAALDAGGNEELMHLSLNENKHTAPAKLYLQSIGMDEETIIYLMTQPNVRRYVEQMDSTGFDSRQVLLEIGAPLGLTKFELNYIKNNNAEKSKAAYINFDELKEVVENEDYTSAAAKEYFKAFVKALYAGNDLVDIYKGITPDTADGMGDLAQIQAYIGTVDRLRRKGDKALVSWDRIDGILNGDAYPLSRAYYQAIKSSLEVAGELFLGGNISVKNFKDLLMDTTGKTLLTEQEHRFIDRMLFYYMLTKEGSPMGELLKKSDVEFSLTNTSKSLASRILEMMEQIPALKNNTFLLKVAEPSNVSDGRTRVKGLSIDTVEKMTPELKEAMIDGFYKLLFQPETYTAIEKDQKRIQNLGKILVTNAMVTTGLAPTYGAYFDAIPADFFTSFEVDGVTPAEFFRKEFNNAKSDPNYFYDFMIDFVRNFGTRTMNGRPLIPRLNAKLFLVEDEGNTFAPRKPLKTEPALFATFYDKRKDLDRTRVFMWDGYAYRELNQMGIGGQIIELNLRNTDGSIMDQSMWSSGRGRRAKIQITKNGKTKTKLAFIDTRQGFVKINPAMQTAIQKAGELVSIRAEEEQKLDCKY